MRCILFWILVVIISSPLDAQLSPGRMSLVQTEREFARSAKYGGLKSGFLKNLSPDAELLEQGHQINGMASWQAKRDDVTDSGFVYWDPVFVDLSSSEDFGYTTGPLQFYKYKTDTLPAGRAYFTSIWEKDRSGTWKLIFDLGGSASESLSPSLHTSSIVLSEKFVTKERGGSGLSAIFDLDSNYNALLIQSNKTADPAFFSTEGRLYRSRNQPLIGKEQVAGYRDLPGRQFQFAKLGGKMAQSGDMAYSYGRVVVTINESGTQKKITVGYLRIWKKEDGKNWRIVLDTLG